MRIALAGNPNSGKTTMYNALTGSHETVGNWAGVTVEKKEHPLKKIYCGGRRDVQAVDLPGAYSMSPFTSEESVTSEYVRNECPDVIINIVDASNLGRSLFFTTQLLELGIPMVVALNKADINEKRETVIDVNRLSERLGCPVLLTVSTSAKGLRELVKTALAQVGKSQSAPYVQPSVDLTDRDAVALADKQRFAFVDTLVAETETRKTLSREITLGDKVDVLLSNKWIGIPVFAFVMFLVFQISQVWVGPFVADALCGWLELFQEWVRGLLSEAHPLVSALLVDGVIGGAIAVIGFLPLVMVMYFLIALLEDCGYMSRVSVVLDPIFKKVGLSGKSVIPFVIAVGCAVPGIMASRTIRDERERRATAMIAPFMPCGAKIPLISLFAGAFFNNAGWVSTAMYLGGILIIFLCALLVNKITGRRVQSSYFIIELPSYKVPDLWRAVLSMCSRGWEYIVKAATIILLCNTAVQVMQSFNWQFRMVEEGQEATSILASVAGPFAYVLIPIIGVLSWQMAAATITGFIAKENVVGTLAVCFAATRFINAEEMAIVEGAELQAAGVMTGLNGAGETVSITAVAALAFLVFNLFTPPCFAAMAAMSSELKSAKWFWSGIALQLGVGFTVAFTVYQIGTLLTAHTLGAAFWTGLAAIAVMAGIVTALCIRAAYRTKKG